MKALLLAMAVTMILPVGAPKAPDPVIKNGLSLYRSMKFKCFQCHGLTGREGGHGPSFKGIAHRLPKRKIFERAAHKCPPTKMCNPKELNAIVEYLMTL